MTLTLQDRADAYAAAFPQFPASHLRVVTERSGSVMYGTWLVGSDYRNRSEYYGAYPPSYLERVHALFPEQHTPDEILHVFSGSLPPGPYLRCDLRQPSELPCTVYDLPGVTHRAFRRPVVFALVLADPPYSPADAERYGTPMVDRRRALTAIATVTRPGGHLVWLDVCWPQHRKAEWRTCGRITLVRSTNHRVRLVSIFERVAA